MPPHTWATDPVTLVQAFEARHAQREAGALLVWAAWSVDCLHYLDDVDGEYDRSRTVRGGHRPDVVDIAHVRWATGTCITALDLCAAGLGRTFCRQTSARELALPDFDPNPPANRRNRVTALR